MCLLSVGVADSNCILPTPHRQPPIHPSIYPLVIIAASDGIFDNMWDDELLTVLSKSMGWPSTPQPPFTHPSASAHPASCAATAHSTTNGSPQSTSGTTSCSCNGCETAAGGTASAAAAAAAKQQQQQQQQQPRPKLKKVASVGCWGRGLRRSKAGKSCGSITHAGGGGSAAATATGMARAASAPDALGRVGNGGSSNGSSYGSSKNCSSCGGDAGGTLSRSSSGATPLPPPSAATAATPALAQRAANALAQAAFRNAGDEAFKSPWAAAAGRQGLIARLFAKGGKMDDCTCVVAVVADAGRLVTPASDAGE